MAVTKLKVFTNNLKILCHPVCNCLYLIFGIREWSEIPLPSDGVATISGLLKVIGLFCKRAIQKRRYSAKETWTGISKSHQTRPVVRAAAGMHASVCARARVLVCVCVCLCDGGVSH